MLCCPGQVQLSTLQLSQLTAATRRFDYQSRCHDPACSVCVSMRRHLSSHMVMNIHIMSQHTGVASGTNLLIMPAAAEDEVLTADSFLTLAAERHTSTLTHVSHPAPRAARPHSGVGPSRDRPGQAATQPSPEDGKTSNFADTTLHRASQSLLILGPTQ